MPATVIVGAQWGDEGKGKIVDLLALDSDVVCRYQGGPNAGHTIVRDGETFAVQWDRWQAQFERFVQREHPVQNADLVLDVTGADLADPRSGTTVET